MFVGGSSTHLRIWDVAREHCVSRVSVCPKQESVTTMASPWPGVGVVIVGASNGSLTMVDLRVPTASDGSLHPSWASHDPVMHSFDTSRAKRWVVKAACQRIGSCFEFVSGNISVRLCASVARSESPIDTAWPVFPDSSTGLCCCCYCYCYCCCCCCYCCCLCCCCCCYCYFCYCCCCCCCCCCCPSLGIVCSQVCCEPGMDVLVAMLSLSWLLLLLMLLLLLLPLA
jgi:hypothetical protein